MKYSWKVSIVDGQQAISLACEEEMAFKLSATAVYHENLQYLIMDQSCFAFLRPRIGVLLLIRSEDNSDVF